MDSDTKNCSACNERLPLDAAFCNACGTAQKARTSSSDSLGAFALVEDEAATASAPETPPPAAPEPPGSESIELESVQLDDEDLDDGLLEEREPEAEEIELEEISLEDDDEAEGEASGNRHAPEPSTPEASPPEIPQEESAETSNTVRMSMSDVVQAWNEEAKPDGSSEPGPEESPPPAAKGLPPGFIVALIASLAVVAVLVYFLT